MNNSLFRHLDWLTFLGVELDFALFRIRWTNALAIRCVCECDVTYCNMKFCDYHCSEVKQSKGLIIWRLLLGCDLWVCCLISVVIELGFFRCSCLWNPVFSSYRSCLINLQHSYTWAALHTLILYTYREYRDHVKDLSCISQELCRVVIVDNNPFSFLLQPLNGIPCVPFSAGQPHDDQVIAVPDNLIKVIQPIIYSIITTFRSASWSVTSDPQAPLTSGWC